MATEGDNFNVSCVLDFQNADPAVNMLMGTVVDQAFDNEQLKVVFLEQGTLTDCIFQLIKPKIEEIKVTSNSCMIFVLGRKWSANVDGEHKICFIRETVSGFDDAIANNDHISHVAKKCTPRSGHAPSTVTTKIPIETLYERSTELFRNEVDHPVHKKYCTTVMTATDCQS